MAHYSKKAYWDNRYSQDSKPFDWYQSYSTLQNIICKYATKEDKILHVGCGNSRLIECIKQDGYNDVKHIDISSVVIQQMSEKHMSGQFEIMDVRKMAYANETFNIAIDKGTLDSVACSETDCADIESMLSEIHRVLKLNGVYICVSNARPEIRTATLSKLLWKVEIEKLKKINANNSNDEERNSSFHYVYICTKQENKIDTKPIEINAGDDTKKAEANKEIEKQKDNEEETKTISKPIIEEKKENIEPENMSLTTENTEMKVEDAQIKELRITPKKALQSEGESQSPGPIPE